MPKILKVLHGHSRPCQDLLLISYRKAFAGRSTWRHLWTGSLVNFQGSFPGWWWRNERGGDGQPEGRRLGIRVKWVETWRDGSTSRDQSVAPRQPLPNPYDSTTMTREVSGKRVSIDPLCPCYTKSSSQNSASRRTNDRETMPSLLLVVERRDDSFH